MSLIGLVALWLMVLQHKAVQRGLPAHSALPSSSASSIQHTVARQVVTGAKAQLGTLYSPDYFDMAYPNGDVPHDRGACTDVVIRALRKAGFDLQRLIHEDMKRDFAAYPHKWGLHRTDTNIDHRRVPNQMCFFRRHGKVLPAEVSPHTLASWQPGDIVTWKLDNGLDHCGIVSDHRNQQGKPLVIHNLALCAEEDVLTTWKITGHFRYPKTAPLIHPR